MSEEKKDLLLIGIAGGTGSGKSTLTQRIVQQFGEAVTVLHHDDYYKAHDELTYEERTKLNYDHPDAEPGQEGSVRAAERNHH